MQHQIPSIHPETLRGETSAPRTTQPTPAASNGNNGRILSDITHGRGQIHHSAGVLGITSHYTDPTPRDGFELEQLELARRSRQSFGDARAAIAKYRDLRSVAQARFVGQVAS